MLVPGTNETNINTDHHTARKYEHASIMGNSRALRSDSLTRLFVNQANQEKVLQMVRQSTTHKLRIREKNELDTLLQH